MKIHQVTHLFHPDQLAGASLYTDLARYFRDQGHEIRVTTTFSYYPRLRYAVVDRGVYVREEVFEGIPLRRVGMWLPLRHKGVMRLAPEITYWAMLSLFGGFAGWTPDVVLAACPMLAQALPPGIYAARGIPMLVVVQDLMAAAAGGLGIIKMPALRWALVALERLALRRATMLSTISEGMRDHLVAITGGTPGCAFIPNWIHREAGTRLEQRRKVVSKSEETTLFYSGNFGVKQGIPDFVRMMRPVRGDWQLRLHGDGPEAQELQAAVSGDKDWIVIGPLLDETAYYDSLLAATACVIIQKAGAGAFSQPSKLLPAIAAGLPVLGICDADSPLGREIAIGRFGEVIAPGDQAELQRVLKRWTDRPEVLREYSANAIERAKNYDRETICRRYEQLLTSLMGRQ